MEYGKAIIFLATGKL